tara:strand:+ start:5567 stop:5785 length:219 start_codon:yes stop_codon:yes gene_type:complete
MNSSDNYIEKPPIESKIKERMDELQHFFELEDYETCSHIIPTVSKFYRALSDDDKEYLQIVQGEVAEYEKTN